MKQKLTGCLLILALLLSLLPTTALASGDDTGMAFAYSYSDLVAALADSTVTELTIYPRWETVHGSGEYQYFEWPETDYTLTLDATNPSCSIWLGEGDWTIPANVTVNAYDAVHMGAPTGEGVIINGTWNCMSGQAILGNVSAGGAYYGSVTVNGTLNIATDVRATPIRAGQFILNGTLNNAGTCYLYSDLTLTRNGRVVNIPKEGIVNSLRELYLYGGSIIAPSDSAAAIGGQITVADDASISGCVTTDQILINSGKTLTINENANVHATRLVCNGNSSSPAALAINGRLTLDTAVYNTISNTQITLGANGVLRLGPATQFGSSSSASTITGTGTLELEGILTQWSSSTINCSQAPAVFGVNSNRKSDDEYLPLTGVDTTVRVVRLWEQCTDHQWCDAGTQAPTCSEQGYHLQVCSVCGTQKRSEITVPTGNHSLTFTALTASNMLRSTCSECGNSCIISITAADSAYTGQPVETAVLNGADGWLQAGDIPAIVYANNVAAGTATASATFGGVTISTTFEIVSCVHEVGTPATCTSGPICALCGLEYGAPLGHTGGTATCRDRAVCTRCGEPYGELGSHSYTLCHNSSSHWVACSVCGSQGLEEYGMTEMTDELRLEMLMRYFETSGSYPANFVLWMEMLEAGEITVSQHVCAEDDSTGACLLCGYTASAPVDFVDVPVDEYFYIPVQWAVANGITTGTSATTFRPNSTCTRAQAVTFLWRAAGQPEPEATEIPFVDVTADDYYCDAVLWAVENGITTGTSATTFRPDSTCTRAQIVTFLWRAAEKPEPETTEIPFVDVTSDDYYCDAVLWAVENGITTGTSATTFRPNSTCTRAQIVTFLYRSMGE